MRGYLSFVLVLASVVLILSFVQIDLSSTNFDLSKAISAERTYQVQMNVKEAVIESVRQGGMEGFLEYDSTHSHQACLRYCADMGVCTHPDTPPCDSMMCGRECFRVSDAQMKAEESAIEKVVELSALGFDPDFEVLLWCGPEPMDFEARDIAERMKSAESLSACASCIPLTLASCGSALTATVRPGEIPDSYALESVQLAPRAGAGVIGISVLSGKLDIASVSYLPQSLEVEWG